MMCVVDYGVGNIQALLNLFNRLGIETKRACKGKDFDNATHLILPGVGHFDHAIQKFNESGIKEPLQNLVLGSKIPLLGVCVGMQMLADRSDEGNLPGLGWIPGRVKEFTKNSESSKLPLPHMGWNVLRPKKNNLLFSGLDSNFLQFYFLHSYYFDTKEKEDILATTHYGFDFASVVSRQNIYGVQFHPEKSHKWGEQLLKNFSKI
jgi:imidazole glycerol-phosphate synthase subunit HisH